MAKRVKRLRHAIAQALSFVGFEGEITVDTTNKSLRVHDESTPGGFEQARADLVNAVSATNANNGKMTALHVQTQEAVVVSAAQNAVDIAAEVVDRVADVDAEEARALAAEAALPAAIINIIYPVGSLFIGTTAANPATILGVGNWQAFGQDRLMISAGSTYAAEATGGSKDAVNVAHGHADDISVVAVGAHTHDIEFASVGGIKFLNQMTSGDFSAITASPTLPAGSHSHTLNGGVTDSGVSGVDANLPPYIGVYMWKRIS